MKRWYSSKWFFEGDQGEGDTKACPKDPLRDTKVGPVFDSLSSSTREIRMVFGM